jgi:D-proline reductase (dithiol) PrdB
MTHSPNISFAPEADRPIAYVQRTRDWYLALGCGNPYVGARKTSAGARTLR